MKTFNPITIVTVLIAVLFLGFACNEPIPDQDLQAAKRAIAVAEQAKAEKYDPENLSKARENYKTALKQVVDDENKAARLAAASAKETADIATENSRRKLAEETMADARRMIKDAEDNRAGFLAEEELAKATAKLADAQKNYDEKKYVEAYTDAENAKEAAGKARDTAQRKMNELNKAFNDADMALKRAEANETVLKYAKSELDQAKAKHQSAMENKAKVDNPSTINADSKENRNRIAKAAYQQALQDSAAVQNAANDVLRMAMEREKDEYRKKAEKKMNEAKRLVEELKKLQEKGLIKDKALLRMMKRLAPPPPPQDGDDYSDDGSGDGNGGDTDDGSSTSTNTTTSTNGLSNKEKYNAAVNALDKAEKSYQNKDYLSTIKNSEEAIRLAKLIKEKMKASKYYKVRLIPEARDCLWRIASYSHIYGDAKMWPKIWKANKHLIVDPDLIYPGQKFAIPPKE